MPALGGLHGRHVQSRLAVYAQPVHVAADSVRACTRTKGIGKGARVPLPIGHAHVHELKTHDKVRQIHPEGAVVDARPLKPMRQLLAPLC